MVKNVAYKENKEITQRCIEIVNFIKKGNLSNVYLSEGYKATKEESLHQRHD